MGEERRITDLTAISAFRSNDYIAVDNASEAQTKKLPASAITGAISAAQTDATRALNIARSTSSFPTGDAYSSSSSYKVGDMVIYNNTLYRCKTACSPASWSVNASNFESISLASALTDLNNDLTQKEDKTVLGYGNRNFSGSYQPNTDYPDYDWKEIIFIAKYSAIQVTLTLKRKQVEDYSGTNPYTLVAGWYTTPTNNGAVSIQYNKTKFSLYTFYMNSANQTSATCDVYYR